ncbi:hypothetical protein CS828_004208 [Escherichia coli]|nr:hypothetical protein [Escherichia coli]EGN7773799.1 hypothetical protein [Salmonella enterica subsp. enterica serovar Muenster]ELE7473769.1 hypothetical protein [Salmonella enterica]
MDLDIGQLSPWVVGAYLVALAVVDEEVSRIDPLWQEHNWERWAGRPADVVAN